MKLIDRIIDNNNNNNNNFICIGLFKNKFHSALQ